MHRLRARVWAGPAVAAVVVLLGCRSVRPSSPRHVPSPAGDRTRSCLIIDTDAALDDLRAIAAVVATRPVSFIVATEGVASADGGALAVRHLLAAAPGAQIPVVIGAASPLPSDEHEWLPAARVNAERLNGFLAEAIPGTASNRVEDGVERLASTCSDIQVLEIGPWTSFVRYRPRLGARLRGVVAQGLPLEDVKPAAAPGFNCRYDVTACRDANSLLRAANVGVWVDVPVNASPTYSPTPDMIAALSSVGLPGTLKAILLRNPAAWTHSSMWDDSAALYLLHPDAFAPNGGHMEPRLPPEELRRLWADSVNRSAN